MSIRESNLHLDENILETDTSDSSTCEFAENFYDLAYFMHYGVEIEAFNDACSSTI